MVQKTTNNNKTFSEPAAPAMQKEVDTPRLSSSEDFFKPLTLKRCTTTTAIPSQRIRHDIKQSPMKIIKEQQKSYKNPQPQKTDILEDSADEATQLQLSYMKSEKFLENDMHAKKYNFKFDLNFSSSPDVEIISQPQNPVISLSSSQGDLAAVQKNDVEAVEADFRKLSPDIFSHTIDEDSVEENTPPNTPKKNRINIKLETSLTPSLNNAFMASSKSSAVKRRRATLSNGKNRESNSFSLRTIQKPNVGKPSPSNGRKSIFEITENSVFSNKICVNSDSEMSPIVTSPKVVEKLRQNDSASKSSCFDGITLEKRPKPARQIIGTLISSTQLDDDIVPLKQDIICIESSSDPEQSDCIPPSQGEITPKNLSKLNSMQRLLRSRQRSTRRIRSLSHRKSVVDDNGGATPKSTRPETKRKAKSLNELPSTSAALESTDLFKLPRRRRLDFWFSQEKVQNIDDDSPEIKFDLGSSDEETVFKM